MNDKVERVPDPSAADLFVARGEEASSREDWMEAKAFFEKARELDPGSWKAIQGLGVVNFWQGRREEAWTLLVEALRRAPEDDDNAANLLDVARSLGREQEADNLVASLRTGAHQVRDASPAEEACVRGEELLSAELWQEAAHPFLEAIDRDAERSRAWSGLGISCFRRGLHNAGLVFFEMALRLDPSDEDCVLNWCESCNLERDDAKAFLESAGVPGSLVEKGLEVLGK